MSLSSVMRLFIILFLPGLLYSCGSSVNESKQHIINIDSYLSRKDTIRMSEFFSGYKIIPLETLPENYIGSISAIRIVDSTIFLFDMFGTKAVDTYTIDGKFKRRFRSVGRGPGEYIQPTGFDIDEESGNFHILDWNTAAIYTYDGATGEFLKKTNTPDGWKFNGFFQHKDGFCYFDGVIPDTSSLYYLWDVDSKTGAISRFLPISDMEYKNANIPFTQFGFYSKTDSATKIFWPLRTEVYEYREGKVNTFLSLETEKFKATEEDYQLRTPFLMIDKLMGIMSYSDNGEMAFLYFMIGTKRLYTLFDFRTGVSRCAEVNLWNDDIAGVNSKNLCGIWDNYLVTYIHPSSTPSFLKILQNGKVKIPEPERTELEHQISKNIKAGEGISNPILILYKFREN
jgi:hypothetical protein